MKSLVVLVTLGVCVISVSSAGIPTKSSEILSTEVSSSNSEGKVKSAVEARGHGYDGTEWYSGPGVVIAAPVIAITFLALLWIAAYNNIREAPPRFGYDASLVKHVERNAVNYAEESAPVGSHVAAVASGARAFDQLTQRVISSIEKHETSAAR